MRLHTIVVPMLVLCGFIAVFSLITNHLRLSYYNCDVINLQSDINAPKNVFDDHSGISGGDYGKSQNLKRNRERLGSLKEYLTDAGTNKTSQIAKYHTERKIDIVDSTADKPKLFLHVGPRKTATTTIQTMVLRAPDFVATLLEDNIINIDYDWDKGVNLVELCLQKLPDECDKNLWNAFFITELEDAYERKKNVVVSNEAFSLVQVTEDVKKMFLTLTKTWEVRIIMAYRPLETWYPSMYAEDRAQTIFKKRNKQFRDWVAITKEVPEPCNDPITDWFDKHWKEVYLGDSLETYNTYKDIFGKDKVRVLSMIGPDGIDITQQFICNGLEAKHACKFAKSRRTPSPQNQSHDKRFPLFYNNDLLAIGAYKRGLLKKDRLKCNTEHRYTFSKVIQEFKESKGIRHIEGLPQVCISNPQMDELKQRSWLANKEVSIKSLSREMFDESFAIVMNSGKFCSVDVPAVLSDAKWELFFKTDERLCRQYWKNMTEGGN